MTNAPTAPKRRYMTPQQALRHLMLDLVEIGEDARRQADLEVPESLVTEGSEIVDENLDKRLEWLAGAAWAVAQFSDLEDKLADAEEDLDEASGTIARLERKAEAAEAREIELTRRVTKLNAVVRYLEATSAARGAEDQTNPNERTS